MSLKDPFRASIERVIWSYQNLSNEDRAGVLREYAEALEADESRFDDPGAWARHTLAEAGHELPEEEND